MLYIPRKESIVSNTAKFARAIQLNGFLGQMEKIKLYFVIQIHTLRRNNKRCKKIINITMLPFLTYAKV